MAGRGRGGKGMGMMMDGGAIQMFERTQSTKKEKRPQQTPRRPGQVTNKKAKPSKLNPAQLAASMSNLKYAACKTLHNKSIKKIGPNHTARKKAPKESFLSKAKRGAFSKIAKKGTQRIKLSKPTGQKIRLSKPKKFLKRKS